MEKLKNKIVEYIRKNKSKITFYGLKKALSLDPDEVAVLQEILDELELAGTLYLNDCEEYMLFPKDSKMVVGEVRLDSRRRPFVLSGSNMIFIPDNCLHGAITGDIVLIKRNNHTKIPNDPVIVKKIIKRQKGELVFECRAREDGKLVLEHYNSPFKFPITLSKKDEQRLIIGDRLLVNVSLTEKNGVYAASIISRIGHKDDPDVDIRTIASSYGIRLEFPKEVEDELESIPTEVSESEIRERVAKGGRDLRDKMIFTIDSRDTKDIDDAISLEINEAGNYVLGVHIADVAHYVKEGSAIQKEALARGTSCYLVDSVIPMLPHKLSSGICSLQPDVDRLAMTCQIEIDPTGKIVNYEIFESIIRSKKKMVYEDINEIFDNLGPKRDYGPYYTTLQRMFKLSDILSNKMKERGYLNFGDNEVKIRVDEEGKPKQAMLRTRGSSEKLIENFMLAANEVIAEYPSDTFIKYVDLPYVYRIHDLPNEMRIKEIVEYLQKSGYRIRNGNFRNPHSLQDTLRKLSELEEFPIISEIMLRGLSKARYSTHNIGHFGLALDSYTHFTAPIRRYPDLQTHYNLKNYTTENLMNIDITAENKKMVEVCAQASLTERRADQAERAVTQYKMAELMEDKIGWEYPGMVTYISRTGISVKTDEHITGHLSMQDLNEIGFQLDSTFTKLIKSGSSERLALGDRVNISVKYANKEQRKILFELVHTPTKDNDPEKVYKRRKAS